MADGRTAASMCSTHIYLFAFFDSYFQLPHWGASVERNQRGVLWHVVLEWPLGVEA